MKKILLMLTLSTIFLGVSTFDVSAAPRANSSIYTFNAGGDTGVRGSGSFNGGRADEVNRVYYKFELSRAGIVKDSSSGVKYQANWSVNLRDYEYSNSSTKWTMYSFGRAYLTNGNTKTDQDTTSKYIRAYH